MLISDRNRKVWSYPILHFSVSLTICGGGSLVATLFKDDYIEGYHWSVPKHFPQCLVLGPTSY